MKKIVAFILVLNGCLPVFSQQGYEDVIYLKEGSIIRGTIIEQVPNVSLKIQTADRNVFVYQIDDVEKITKEPLPNSKSSAAPSSGVTPAYFGDLSVVYGFGINDNAEGLSTMNMDIINGFQLYPYFSVGIGTGVKVWFIKNITEKPILIPAFVDLRGHFLPGKVSPFLDIQIGYCWEVSPIAQGLGLMFNPSAGVSIKTGKTSRFHVGTGYSMIRISKVEEGVSMWNFSFGTTF
jgi:hypothetical protein